MGIVRLGLLPMTVLHVRLGGLFAFGAWVIMSAADVWARMRSEAEQRDFTKVPTRSECQAQSRTR